MRVLFICKKRVHNYGIPCGLDNSARFVVQALNSFGIEAKLVTVIDNNGIDREVTNYDPTHIIIEALWVVPEKIHQLINLKRHKKRVWFVRLHSEMPFLSMEGIAVKWLKKYAEISAVHDNFFVSANNVALQNNLIKGLYTGCVYQPNIYYIQNPSVWSAFRSGFRKNTDEYINIGCFGAIRPLKNNLIQAFSAIQFADSIGKHLRFHMNATRVEQRGEEVFKNIRNLFPIGGHDLVEHPWMCHDDFMKLISKMDISMQVSFSESFNIVAADCVVQNVPVVTSNEIEFVHPLFQAGCTDTDDIVTKLNRAWTGTKWSLQTLNYRLLMKYNTKSLHAWIRSLS